MAISDVFVALMCLLTIIGAVGLNLADWRSKLAVLSTVMLLVHAIVLFVLGGFLARLFVLIVREGSGAFGDPEARIYERSKLRLLLDRHLGSLPELPNWAWYTLVGLGVLPQMVLVAITGGMDKSPFAQILMATFVLGQFRASTGRAIWALFGAAVASALATHLVYLLFNRWQGWTFADAFQARYFIAPGFLVAFASTLIYWITFKLDRIPADQRPLRE